MKKFLTLVLALVLALGLAAPAMAFTSDDVDDDTIPYTLDIYLVEYDDNDFFGLATLPESDRGYAKNEVVAAVIELFVPKNEDPVSDGYETLDISGENVTFAVNEDPIEGKTIPTAANSLVAKNPAKKGWTLDLDEGDFEGKETFKWLVFAKVTDDEASITVKLIDGSGTGEFSDDATNSSLELTIDGDDYLIVKSAKKPTGDFTYTIYVDNGSSPDDVIVLWLTKAYKTIGMKINGTEMDMVKGKVGIRDTDGKFKTSGTAYDAAIDVYDDIVIDVFGLDYANIGNFLRDSFFEDLESADTISATVDIEPWTAYVTVPDNIVVDPPKTGDAASILGFAMVALSGAGVVALRKRG